LVQTGSSLTADSFNALVLNRSGGSIGSGVSVTVAVGGNLKTMSEGTDAFGEPSSLSLNINSRFDNTGDNPALNPFIGGNANVTVVAQNVSVGGTLLSYISNRGGTIDGNASV